MMREQYENVVEVGNNFKENVSHLTEKRSMQEAECLLRIVQAKIELV